MGGTDKILAKAPGGLKMTPRALESWRAVTSGLTCYCVCSAYLRACSGPSRAWLSGLHSTGTGVRASGLLVRWTLKGASAPWSPNAILRHHLKTHANAGELQTGHSANTQGPDVWRGKAATSDQGESLARAMCCGTAEEGRLIRTG